MAKYHINPKGDPGLCTAEFGCPFASSDEHYSTASEARAAYEKKQVSAFKGGEGREPAYNSWSRGKKLRKAELDSLPEGAIVQWPDYEGTVKVYKDWKKTSGGEWKLADGSSSHLARSTYLAGSGGNEQATFVSADGALTKDLPPLAEKAARRKPQPKWGIVRVSNVTSKVYLDHEIVNERLAKKKFAELNQYDHLHHHYELLPIEEARARKTD